MEQKACSIEQPIHHEAGMIAADKVLHAMIIADAMGRARKSA